LAPGQEEVVDLHVAAAGPQPEGDDADQVDEEDGPVEGGQRSVFPGGEERDERHDRELAEDHGGVDPRPGTEDRDALVVVRRHGGGGHGCPPRTDRHYRRYSSARPLVSGRRSASSAPARNAAASTRKAAPKPARVAMSPTTAGAAALRPRPTL